MPGNDRRPAVTIIEQDNYRVARDLAREKIARLDPAAQARRCAVDFGGETFRVPFLGRECLVSYPEGVVSWAGAGGSGEPEPPLWEQILVLHYLGSDDPLPASRDLVTFAQIPSGSFYDPAFQKRAQVPLVRAFGQSPELLVKAGDALGGHREAMGDASITIPAFPNVPVTIVVWRGDEEFPAEASILFRGDVSGYLSTEDVAVLAGVVASRLIRIARGLG